MKRLIILLTIGFLIFGGNSLAEDITARSQKVFTVPGNYQVLIDYDGGTNPIYVGYADKGLATAQQGWFILKLTWDVNNNPTVIKSVGNAIWDSRTSYTYS